MNKDIGECLNDTDKINTNCKDIWKYRLPVNNDFGKFNPFMEEYIYKRSPYIKEAEKEMNNYCENLSFDNCKDPCSKYGFNSFFKGDKCGYKKRSRRLKKKEC